MYSRKLIKVVLLFPLFSIAFHFIIVSCTCYAEKVHEEPVNKADSSKKSFHLSANNGLLTLDTQDADVRKLLEEIYRKTGIEIEIYGDLKGTISTSFCDISLEEALKKIFINSGIIFSKKEGQDVYEISRIMILPGSGIKGITRDRSNTVKYPSQDSSKGIFTTVKTGSQKRHPHSFTVREEKTDNKSKVVSNELVVRFKKSLSKDDIQSLIAKAGATVKSHIGKLNYYVLSFPSHLSVNEALQGFRQQNVIEEVEPNYLIPLKTLPTDPKFPKQWALHNTARTDGADDADIDAVEAWDIEQGRAEVVIAIIDTGVDYTHEDLAPNIWHNSEEIPDNGVDDDGNGYLDDTIGWDFVDSFGGAAGEDFITPDNDPMDKHGHGSLIAGIAGAVANNDLGIAGVAWNCKIMPVRAGYKTPSGDGVLESDDAAQAIIYAAENGAKVINLSWGDYQESSLIEDAMAYAIDKGALICAAAGNDNSNSPIYPAASNKTAVLTVGATDSNDQMASFSNYGDWVDVSAPGVSIYSTYLDHSYLQMDGTSLASPHVAGLAALLFSYFPDISPLEGKTRIMRSVDLLEDLKGENITSGRINAYSALTKNYTTPHIFSLSPNNAHEGDEVTIFGDSFGDKQGAGVVKIYPDKDAEIISWSNSIIVCKVPDGAQTGELTVTTSEGTSNGVEIAILIKYYDETLIENEFFDIGQAQRWQADDQSWVYQLPFSFPFFGQDYDNVNVCSNGYLDFTNSASSYINSPSVLKTRVMIAPLWDDLITNGTSQSGEDIYIYSPSADSVCFRWAGESYKTGDPIHVEVVLYRDGRIQFNYGPGNTGLSPTIGISGGGGKDYDLGVYDGKNALTAVESLLFTPRQQSFTISLDSGWNLISLPLKPDNDQVGQVMGDLNGDIESVWGYKDEGWLVYEPRNPELSDLQMMKTDYGYWVKTTREGLSLQIRGRPCPMSFSLINGWNLIGFNSLQSMPVEEALKGIQGEVECVWGYKDGVWSVYDPQNPGVSDLEEIEPGMGYWVKLSEN